MQRRRVIQSLAFIPFGLALNGCKTSNVRGLEVWQPQNQEYGDARLQLLSYARLAPSPHNIQPWRVTLLGQDRFTLHVDKERLLLHADPYARQVHLSLGAFLENLDIAARHLGWQADIEYFPEGEYANDVVTDKAVALVRIIRLPMPHKTVLFEQLIQRQSNKRIYEDRVVTADVLQQLGEQYAELAYPLNYLQDQERREQLIAMVVEAMAVDVEDKDRRNEVLEMFRLSSEEVDQHRDGFTVAQSGVTGLKKYMAEYFFLSKEKMLEDGSRFAAESVDLTRKQAESAAAFAWLSSAGNSRRDQVLVGRTYERIHLAASGMGISMQPFSQALQEYPAMTTLNSKLKSLLEVPQSRTIQMLFRLGYAEAVPHTPRRKLQDFVA